MSRRHAEAPVTTRVIEHLPAIFREDQFTHDFVSGFDAVLAPIIATLSCVDAYVDPEVSPGDFLAWLGDWVGLTLEEDWPEARRRRAIAAAAEVYAARGTAHGLRRELAVYTDGRVHVEDGGSTITSAAPGSLDGAQPSDQSVRVVIDVDDAETVNWTGLRDVVRNAVPAHLPFEIELRAPTGSETP